MRGGSRAAATWSKRRRYEQTPQVHQQQQPAANRPLVVAASRTCILGYSCCLLPIDRERMAWERQDAARHASTGAGGSAAEGARRVPTARHPRHGSRRSSNRKESHSGVYANVSSNAGQARLSMQRNRKQTTPQPAGHQAKPSQPVSQRTDGRMRQQGRQAGRAGRQDAAASASPTGNGKRATRRITHHGGHCE
ncbi:hypothetical protein BC831DRAFT_496817, partial [Entophlyctis helioformis]